jgi:hypothetical protein
LTTYAAALLEFIEALDIGRTLRTVARRQSVWHRPLLVTTPDRRIVPIPRIIQMRTVPHCAAAIVSKSVITQSPTRALRLHAKWRLRRHGLNRPSAAPERGSPPKRSTWPSGSST